MNFKAVAFFIFLVVFCFPAETDCVCLPGAEAGAVTKKFVTVLPPKLIGSNCTVDVECDEEVCHSVENKCGQAIYGSACSRDLDCVTLNCLNGVCTSRVSSKTCTKQSDCPDGYHCLLVDGTGTCAE